MSVFSTVVFSHSHGCQSLIVCFVYSCFIAIVDIWHAVLCSGYWCNGWYWQSLCYSVCQTWHERGVDQSFFGETSSSSTRDWSVRTHTYTQPFNGRWSGTTWVGRYQKKHSPTHTHPGHRTSFINFLHLLQSIASSVFSLCAWQFSLTTSVQVLFVLPLGLGSSTSYSMHFFTQSLSSFHSTCPYQCSLVSENIKHFYLFMCSLVYVQM